MGKIDELIKQLCQCGVKRVKLVDYAKVQYGFAFNSKLFTDDSANIPLIRIRDVLPGKSSTYYLGEYGDEYIVKKGDILVGMDGNFNLEKWNDRNGLLNQRVCKIFTKDARMLLDGFLYHYLKPVLKKIENSIQGSTVKHLSAKVINGIEIPLPPLAVQKEIVEILDTFTGMMDNLQKELDYRQKQFEYYRDKLFMFKGNIKNEELGKICSIKGRIGFRGYTKNDFVEFKKGAISLSPGDIKDNQLYFDNCSYISWDKYEQSPEIIVERGDILLCKTGSVGKTAIVQELPWKATINPQFVILKNVELNNKYLFYALCLPCTQIEIKRLAGVGSVPNVSQAKLAKVEIPMPSLETQQEIVDKLDTFEALISNIKQEIELRKKQYEYYREKLLTFE